VRRRVVFDTSTLVSAALRVDSIPHQALLAAIGTCDLCASVETLDELARVLKSAKFDRYMERGVRADFVCVMRRNVHLFAVSDADLKAGTPPCRDKSDHQFLALARVAGVGVLVSSDQDLLLMHPWHGIAIVTPREFLSEAGG